MTINSTEQLVNSGNQDRGQVHLNIFVYFSVYLHVLSMTQLGEIDH